MILINRTETDPYFNIAAEEYFLKNYNEEIVMIWQSAPCVVLGKHQNTFSEVNSAFADKKNLPVIRRISGGGTVYHDDGNINYSIITQSPNREMLIDFHKSTEPIIGFLSTLGLNAEFSGKNNLTINGKKFSGNSAHVYKNRVLHHGTILFNSDLDNLERAITPPKYTITDKAVKSIRANVTNLSDLIQDNLSIDDFKSKLTEFLIKHMDIKSIVEIGTSDKEGINKLIADKYSSWDWNYGYSPSYHLENSWDGATLSMKVEKGIISEVELTGKLKNKSMVSNLLIGLPINPVSIGNIFSSLSFSKKVTNHYFRLLGLK